MAEQYINPEAKWFVIVDVTEPDFASVVNCTFDTKEGAKKLMENWKEEVAGCFRENLAAMVAMGKISPEKDYEDEDADMEVIEEKI